MGLLYAEEIVSISSAVYDIFCRLSTMHERDRQTDRSRNGNIDCNWRCRLIMRQFIEEEEEEEEDIYLNAVTWRKSLQRRLITLDASTAAIDRSSKPEPQKDNKKNKNTPCWAGFKIVVGSQNSSWLNSGWILKDTQMTSGRTLYRTFWLSFYHYEALRHMRCYCILSALICR